MRVALVAVLGLGLGGLGFRAAGQDRVAERLPRRVLYVSPAGQDGWTGALPDANPAQTDGPFATLSRARDELRRLKQAGALPDGGAVLVRAGTYEIGTTFALTAADAGTEAAPILYRAYPGERAILTGARRIVGFVPHQGAILTADVGAQGFKGIAFRQLFLDGRRQILARYPNFDAANPHGGGFAYVDGEPLSMYKDLPDENVRLIQCKRRDVRTWAHPEKGEVIIFPRYNWHNWAMPIASADPAQGTITLAKDMAWGQYTGFRGIRPLDRFYIRNLMEELDAPGEWYLDTETWTLYFQPPGPLGQATVRAPVVETLVEIGPQADWITLRGFTLEGCEGAAVVVRGSAHVLIAGNTLHDTGGRLASTAAVMVQGGRDCGVVGNDIFDVGNYGIRLESDSAAREALTPSGHYADNNYLHHIGGLNGHGCGIYLAGIGLRVSHNLIHDTTRCGIFGGGNDCVVEYNHIRHVNLETEDTGGYYVGGNWHVRGHIIRYNYIHDVLGYGRTGDTWTSPHFAWGIYLDDDHSGAHVYGNIVARTTLGGAHIHAGRDNLLENNIFIDHTRQQMQYSGHDPKSEVVASHLVDFKKAMAKPAYREKYPELAAADPNTLWLMAGNQFRRNIIYYRSPQAKLYQYSRNDVPEQNTSDYNLIWHDGLPLDVGLPGVPREKQWEEWQKRGFDTHSMVADPLFVDAAKDDYRLRPESPAFKLGFEPIPVDKIGPYASPLRATWPIVEAPGVRETPLVETKVEIPKRPVRLPPQTKAPKLAAAPVLDGEVRPGEWPEASLLLQEAPDGVVLKTAPGVVRLGHDGTTLYVAVTVPVQSASGVRLGEAWGEADAAEVCFQGLSGPQPGPIFIIHGFASGKHESVTEAGASAEMAQRLGAATRFAAKLGEKQWTGEWAIPLAAAGLAYRPGLTLGLNFGVRRSATQEWLQWRGSGATWHLQDAGTAQLE
jgi:hypothetical protein